MLTDFQMLNQSFIPRVNSTDGDVLTFLYTAEFYLKSVFTKAFALQFSFPVSLFRQAFQLLAD